MQRKLAFWSYLLIHAMSLLISPSVFAGSFEVAPTTITLSSEKPSGMLHVTNRGSSTVFAQIEAFDWHQPDGKDKLTPSHALLISPPMARLLPGQAQTVRLMVSPGASGNGAATEDERTFRLVISELPDPAANKDGIQVLLQFIVPVFVQKEEKAPPQLECAAAHADNGLAITLRNAGAHHLKLSDITANAAGSNMKISNEAFNYMLPGASHRWNVAKIDVASGAALSVKAQDEGEGALQASCVLGR